MTELMKEEFISIFVQSYIHSDRTNFNWRVDDDKIRKEFRDIYDKIMTEYHIDASKIIFAGMSAGGKLVIDFAFKSFVPISGLVVNCPVVPDDISDELIKEFVAKKKRIAIITGENDFALEGQKKLVNNIDSLAGQTKMFVTKDLGHSFAENFTELLDEYLRWVIQ
jgi:predicted esterase